MRDRVTAMAAAMLAIVLSPSALTAQGGGLLPVGATPREQVQHFQSQMREERHMPEAPYPTASDTEMEVAFAYCIVTMAARGEEGMLGREFECQGSTPYDSVWRRVTRMKLGDAGLGSALSTMPRAAWDRCIDAMLAADPARVREGEALERFCIPALAEPRARRRARRDAGPP